ncbi:MAG: 3-hydroxyacyl-ACP dehydratase [Ginsengibacter sp.]
MNDLFVVIESSATDTGFSTTLELNPGHIIYAGHFPGHPVTPGVIQIQIVHELLENHLGKNLKLITVDQCKFLKTLNPNETSGIVVHIELKEINDLINSKAWGENGTDIFFKMGSTYRSV